jgi:hypothetical protein
VTLTSRETILAWITMAGLLAGGTFLFGRSKFAEWQQINEARASLEEQVVLSERLISQQDTWDERLAANMGTLKVYPAGVNITPKLLETVEQTARNTNLRLSEMAPNKETNLGDVSEVAIRCSWEGNLESMVRFLYGLQNADGLFKIRKLTVTPTGKDGALRGIFTVDCAYTREAAGAENTLQVDPIPAS